MNSKKFHLNILRYYAYSVLSNLLFFLPIDIIFFKERGLDLEQIFLIQTLFSVGVIVFEVPTGIIADHFGRKKSLLLGITTWILS